MAELEPPTQPEILNEDLSPPETIVPDRPRVWPEAPRAPRPQIKRPLEEWLADFTDRVKASDASPNQQASLIRRRRPKGLDRLVPAPTRRAEPEERGRRRGRRR